VKTYDELTEAQQELARSKALDSLLEAVLEGLRFSDELNGDDLQARIDAAGQKADDMRTPWFAAEYIMDDESAAEELRGMAECDAEDALYSERGEWVVAGVA
jgi:hypothetical protein